jgi:hypothetical protein
VIASGDRTVRVGVHGAAPVDGFSDRPIVSDRNDDRQEVYTNGDGIVELDPGEQQRWWREAHFRELIASGVHDVESLRGLRGDESAAATAAWVAEQGARLLVVPLGDVPVFPAFQFDERGELRPALSGHVRSLQDAGLSPWRAWSWLVSPTGRLSGGVPAEMVVSHPGRAAKAVQRMVDQLLGPWAF